MGDLIDIFFNQGTYNGTLKINGGIVVDYVESAEGPASGQTDINTVRNMINTAITTNNRKQAFGAGSAGIGSLGTLSGTTIKGSSISGSSIIGGVIRGARVEDLDGADELFKTDYLDLYSINTSRSDFDIFVRSGYNNIKFSYDTKENDYFRISFGEQLDVNGNAWTQAFPNNYLKSQFFNVLFKPKNNYIIDKSVFQIEKMDLKVGSLSQPVKTEFIGDVFINGSGTDAKLEVNGKRVTAAEGSGFQVGNIDIEDGIASITVLEGRLIEAGQGDILTISPAIETATAVVGTVTDPPYATSLIISVHPTNKLYVDQDSTPIGSSTTIQFDSDSLNGLNAFKELNGLDTESDIDSSTDLGSLSFTINHEEPTINLTYINNGNNYPSIKYSGTGNQSALSTNSNGSHHNDHLVYTSKTSLFMIKETNDVENYLFSRLRQRIILLQVV